MRVLHVGNMYPPHHYGGYELIWRAAVEHLRMQGHEVRVLTTDVRTEATMPDDPGVYRDLRWHLRDGEFEQLSFRARLAQAQHNHRVLGRHLAEMRPDVVAWWSMGGLSLTMLETVRRGGIPAVAFVLDDWLDYGRWADGWSAVFLKSSRRPLRPVAELLSGIPATVDYGGAATYRFISEFARRRALHLEIGLKRTGVAHSGIHPGFLVPVEPKEWTWRLLYLGRIDQRKGIDTAVEALPQLPSEATLTVVGAWDKREENRLRALAERLGVQERVQFAGHRDHDELMRAYEECDAVVFPVRWDEPWGLVPLEAMGRGRPVIATGRGGSAEYLRDEENCLLFEADDVPALASALRRLADEPELRAHLREGGFATAAQHTEPIFNAEVEQELLEAVDPKPLADVSDRPLSILHVGTGFRPLRRGGLVAYVEDLCWEQTNQGHEVSYLFSGRQYRWLSGPRLKTWQRRLVTMLEVINSPLYDHGRQPGKELSEPRLERLFERIIHERRPDVLHVHELAGFPSSILDIAREAGVSVVVTLQDYFPLCPTFKLLDAENRVCLRREIGAECVAATAVDPPDPSLLFDATMRYVLHRRRLIQKLPPPMRDAIVNPVAAVLTRGAGHPASERELPPRARAEAFQRRRDQNVERLNQVDGLIAMSHRVGEIYSLLGVDEERLQVMRLTLAHVERLLPRRRNIGRPVTFATLGGGESEAKGARVLLDAARLLSAEAAAGRFRLRLLGHVDPAFMAEAAGLPGVELGGRYMAHELDDVLADVDVGVMPSIWEEAYGYAGVEFLATGIPVIANKIGGMVEYVREGQTGWLNQACSAEGLARIMRDVIDRPEQVAVLNQRLLDAHDSIVMPLKVHVEETDTVYRDAIASAGEQLTS